MENKILKFRAWDKKNKRMTIDFILNSQGYIYQCYYDKKPELKYDFELMQYTGLKDKNRKEIYEDDIVILGNEPEKYKIIFSVEDGKWLTDNENGDYDNFNENITCWMEVIGNIYENPELLKNKGE